MSALMRGGAGWLNPLPARSKRTTVGLPDPLQTNARLRPPASPRPLSALPATSAITSLSAIVCTPSLPGCTVRPLWGPDCHSAMPPARRPTVTGMVVLSVVCPHVDIRFYAFLPQRSVGLVLYRLWPVNRPHHPPECPECGRVE